MKMKVLASAAIVLSAVASSATVYAADGSEIPRAMKLLQQDQRSAASVSDLSSELKTQLRNIDAMKKLPLSSVSMVQVGDRVLAVSENGRFVWMGGPIDLWSGRKVDTIAAANDLNKVDFEKLGFRFNELPVFEVGTGKSVVTLFVDPYCSACGRLLAEIPALDSEYKFRIVMYPVLGEPSVNITKKLMAWPNKAEAVTFLIKHDYSRLDQAPASNDLPRLQKALLLGRMMNFQYVPVIQYPNKEIALGLPSDGFKKALEGASK